MKNYEVGIIIAAIAIMGYLWWQSEQGSGASTSASAASYVPGGLFPTAPKAISPVNATSSGFGGAGGS